MSAVWRRFLFVLACGVGLVPNAYANGVFTGFNKTLAGGQANPVQVGDTINYNLTVGCVDTGVGAIVGCGDVTMTDHVDGTQLENIQVLGLPPGSNVNLMADTPVAGVTRVVITVPGVEGGDSIAATLRVRVRTDVAVGPTVSNPVAGQTFTVIGTGAPQVTFGGSVSVGIDLPTPQWTLTKTQFEPSGPWVLGEDVVYRLRFTSDTASGNVNLTDVVITDMLPAGATFVDASNGGSESGGVVTWPAFDRNANQGRVDRFLRVRYEAPAFSCNPGVTMVTNSGQANAEHLYSGGMPELVGSDSETTTCTTTPIINASISKNDIAVPIGPGEIREYQVQMEPTNSTNSAMQAPAGFPGPYFQDDIPFTQLDVTSIRSGTWDPVGIQAELFYSTTAAPGTFISLGTVDGNDNSTFSNFGGNTVASLRWVFQSDLPAGFDMNSAGRIRFQRALTSTVGTVMNCIDGHWNDGVMDQTDMNCGDVEIEDETVHVTVFKEMDIDNLTPGQQTEVRLRLLMREESSDDLMNPTIVDLLPPELEFISWDAVNWTGVAPIDQVEPNLEVIENFDAGRTLLRFSWRDTAPVGSRTLLGMAGVDNPLTLVDTTDDQEIELVITVEVAPGSDDNSYTNEMLVFNQTTRNHCQIPPDNNDPPTNDFSETTLDLDGDGNTDAVGCLGSEGFVVVEAAVLRGTKWDIGTDGLPNVDPDMPSLAPNLSCPDRFSGYTRQPCVAQGFNNSLFRYRLELINQGNIQLDDYTLYDILPYVGDTGVSETGSAFPRGSEWRPVLNAQVSPANALATSEATIEYNMSEDPCRAEVSAGPDNVWHGTPGVDCDNNWQADPNMFPNGLADVRSFRIIAPFAGTPWQPGDVMLFDVEMVIPPEALPGEISWNNFAHRVTDQENGIRLATAEPPRVGILVPPAVDYGDLPDPAVATAGEYPTLAANSGPGHTLDPDIFLGECVDNDLDGQPNVTATGDDGDAGGANGVAPIGNCTGGDDEDGIVPLSLIFEEDEIPMLIANVVNNTGNNATLSCWADYNGDGVLDNGTERGQAAANVSGPVLVTMPTVPVGTIAATGGDLYVRCRLSTDPKAENPDDGGTFAPAADGEVEDYRVPVYGDGAPPPPIPAEKDWGDNPDALRTLAASIGPNHGMIADLRMGACVDDETDGQPSTAPASNLDDTGAEASTTFGTCAVTNDDEDGVNPAQLSLFEGFAPVLDIAVVSPNASFISCWADYNGDNVYDNLTEKGTVAVAPGATTVQVTLPIVPVGSASASFARCRIAADAGDVQFAFGPAATGEVEDYPISLSPTGDYGDAPDAGPGTAVGDYETLIASGGPVHALNKDGDANAANDPFLGTCVDSETDGQPNVAANGDDTLLGAPVLGTCTGNNDEDGVAISALILDQQATLSVVSNQSCTLSAFIDYNANGSFADAGEALSFVEGAALAGGGVGSPETKTFTVPVTATEGVTYARFRCTTDGAVDSLEPATDGEVEDYRVEIFNSMDYGDAPDASNGTGVGNYNTRMADSGPSHVLGAADLYMGACVEDEVDGQPAALADGDDNGAANSLTTGTCGTYNGIANNDEDGPVQVFPMLVPGQNPASLDFTVFNSDTTGVPGANLYCWIDYNANGVFDNATERGTVAVPQNAAPQTVTVSFPSVPATVLADTGGATYMRCRISSDSAAADPTGVATNGEIEDHIVQFKPAGAIGNYVWHDEDNDGEQDAGEPGIGGVDVQLKNGTNGAVISTLTTDADGGYLFTGLPPADYEVMVVPGTLPAGFGQTTNPVNGGSDFGNQSQAGPNGGYPITLGLAEENLTADFGYNLNPDNNVDNPGPNDTAALGDKVWIDTDGDGAQDPGEPGIPGVPLSLMCAGADGIFGNADDYTDSTMTNAGGMYYFDNIPPSACAVTVTTPPPGYLQTGDPDHFGTTGPNDNTTTDPVILGPGDVALNVDFGYQPPADQNNKLGDTVWFDTNGDGIEDAGEPGIPGVTVVLLDGAGNPLANATTDANGMYMFQGLPDGDYMVMITDTGNVLSGLINSGDPDDDGTPSNGDEDGKSTVPGLGNGDPNPVQDLDQDFGYTPVGHDPAEGLIGDTVFLDANNNGQPDPGEGIEGVTVKLVDPITNAVIGFDVTDENGMYAFGGLNPTAAYRVMVQEDTLPPGLINTVDPDDDGTDGNGDEDSMSTVDLAADPDGVNDGYNLEQDFGYVPNPALSDPVGTIGTQIWVDSNADGIFDGPNGPDAAPGTDDDEPGIPGVTIDLIADSNGNGLADPGEPVIASTTTAADGSYLFDNLPVDDGTGSAKYIVVVTDTAGVLLGSWHSIGPDEGDAATDDNSQFNAHPVMLMPGGGEDYPLADFGYYTDKAALGNFVWFDANDDGVQDSGEPVIAGATVTLTISYPGGGSVVTTRQTAADGSYSFAGLLCDEDYNGDGNGPEPTFSIEVDLPAGYIPGRINIGSGGTADRNDSDDHTGQSAQPVQGITDMALLADPNSETDPASYDFNALATDFGDLPAPYPTLFADSGAHHIVLPSNNPTLGATVDIESDGVPSAMANGDDLALTPDDEDGVSIPLLVPGTTRNVVVNYINATLGVTTLNAWLDLNGDGTLEQIATDLVAPTAPTGSFTIPVVIPQTATPGNVYARFRFSSDTGLALTGQASDGEVEDYVARIPEVDYGDLPDAYSTLNAATGPFHVIDDVNKLGAVVDHDINGFPGDNADGDDTEAGGAPEETGDDEDGVGFTPMLPGETTDVTLNVMGTCHTSVFLDTNGDNSFDALTIAAGSAVGTPGNAPTDILLNTGTHVLSLNVPANTSGPVHARVRCAVAAGEGNSPTGLAESGGEVEDYVLMSISNRVFLDDGIGGGVGNNGVQDGTEPGIGGVLMQLVQGGIVIATDITDGSGDYEFPGLEPGTYKVQIAASNFGPGQVLEGRLSSTGMGDPNANVEETGDENGMDDGNPAGNGIMSGDVILVLGNAPVGNDTDPNTNDTVDFGLVRVDFGDNPDSFGTSGPGSARHKLDGVTFMGGGVDDDSDGSPSEGANDDDMASDDEDGVAFLTPVAPGSDAAVEVKVNGLPNTTVYLSVWVDFDGNGTFTAGDQIFADEPIALDGTGMALPTLMFTVPISAAGDLYSRFRLAAGPGQVTSATNIADSGEVEDYVLLSIGNRIWMEVNNADGNYDAGEDMPLANILVALEFPAGGAVLDANGMPITTLTDGNGLYRFIGVPPGSYRLRVPASQFQPGMPLYQKEPTIQSVELEPNNNGDDTGDTDGGHNALPNVQVEDIGSPTGIITVSPAGEPTTEDGNGNTNLTVDFSYTILALQAVPTLGLYGIFGLALLLLGLGYRYRRRG